MTLDSLRHALASIPGVEEKPSRFNGRPALWVGRTEVAHFDEADVMDIRLTARLIRARRSELRSNPSVTLRPSTSADWLEVYLGCPEDERLCIELVEAAALANGTLVVSSEHVPKHNDAPGPGTAGDR